MSASRRSRDPPRNITSASSARVVCWSGVRCSMTVSSAAERAAAPRSRQFFPSAVTVRATSRRPGRVARTNSAWSPNRSTRRTAPDRVNPSRRNSHVKLHPGWVATNTSAAHSRCDTPAAADPDSATSVSQQQRHRRYCIRSTHMHHLSISDRIIACNSLLRPQRTDTGGRSSVTPVTMAKAPPAAERKAARVIGCFIGGLTACTTGLRWARMGWGSRRHRGTLGIGTWSTMTGTTPQPQMGWAAGSSTDPQGMIHATYPDEHTALCGADTPYLGDPWPTSTNEWSSTHARCPSCAHRLYTPHRQ